MTPATGHGCLIMATRAIRAAHRLLAIGDRACAAVRYDRAAMFLAWAALSPPDWMSTLGYLRRYSACRRLVRELREYLSVGAPPCPYAHATGARFP